MVGQIPGLDIPDELNLYLVKSGLKPAAMVDIDPRNLPEFKIIEKSENGIENWLIELAPELIETFRQVLTDSGVAYIDWSKEDISKAYSRGKLKQIQKVITHQSRIGKDQKSLDALVKGKTDLEIGLALGYPIEAVKAFQTVIDGERRDGSYNQVCLGRAKKAGKEIPLWLAYINFVPEVLDIVNGNISETSRELGESYQKFVRKTNPGLAKRVEASFRNFKVATSWEKTAKKSYSVCWDYSDQKVETKKLE